MISDEATSFEEPIYSKKSNNLNKIDFKTSNEIGKLTARLNERKQVGKVKILDVSTTNCSPVPCFFYSFLKPDSGYQGIR